jgi:hypothetical protein
MEQIILILILIIFGVLIIIFKDFLKKHRRLIGITLGAILVASRMGRGMEYIQANEFYRVVPLQLCSISTYLALFYFLYDWKKLQLPLFFFGFLGLTYFIDPDIPDWSVAFKTFYLYGITIDHLIITLAPMYLVFIDGFEIEFKKILKPFISVVILIFISWPITLWWEGSNFFYLVEKPVFSDLFSDSMGFFNTFHYILWFFIAFFILNIINWGIIKGIKKIQNKRVEV